MIFRKANESDANELDNLLTRLIQDEQNYDENVELVDVKDFYINYINDPTKYFEVCEDNSKIVGYIYVIFSDNQAKIDALFVDSKYRQLGIATKLLDDTLKYINSKNISNVYINVLENNKKAKKLYSKYFELDSKDGIKETLRLKESSTYEG